MVLVARGLANELRGSIGTRISDGKVFKIDFCYLGARALQASWISNRSRGPPAAPGPLAGRPVPDCLRSRMPEVL